MYKYIKRFLDILFSLILLICLSWLMIITAVLIKIESRGPVIFKQKRLGTYGREFNIYKFRSMCVGAEKMGTGVYSGKGDSRVTRVGKIIRATSIDELPQLLNILKGEMSFIGPRPALTYHPWRIEEYSEFQKKRFDVRQGITGWAQVNGRKQVDWEQRIKYDVYYVENMSFVFDLKILFKTIFNVLAMKDNINNGVTVKTNEPSKSKELAK